MSEISSTRNGIHHQQRRPVKLAMNLENRTRTETADLPSVCELEDDTSDTMLKTPYETGECQQNSLRADAFSALPLLSDSDINSEGESMKNYIFLFSNTSNVDSSGDILPIAFAKIHKYKNESQIF